MDVFPDLKPSEAAYFYSLVGILRWIIDLGRIDICTEVSMMLSYLELPREGHLSHLLQFFSYLRKFHNSELLLDPINPIIDISLFERKDCTSSDFENGDRKEELPTNMPQTRGLGFVLRAKVDAEHAADTLTRRLRNFFLIHLNCATIYWFSKKHTSV